VGQRILCKPMVLIAALFLLPLFLLSASAQQAAPQKEKTAAVKTKDDAGAKSAPADAVDYLGMDTCKTCHEDIYVRLRSMP
jgi:hypothetical protein